MYGIFTYIYHILPLKTTIHVGIYTSPMDPMGNGMTLQSPINLKAKTPRVCLVTAQVAKKK